METTREYSMQAFEWCLTQHNKKVDIKRDPHDYLHRLVAFCYTYGISKSYLEEKLTELFLDKLDKETLANLVCQCYSKTSGFGFKKYIPKRKYFKPVATNLFSIEQIFEWLERKERGDAELLVEFLKKDRKYDHTAKRWVIYKDGVYKKDNTNQTKRKAHIILTRIYYHYHQEIENHINEASKENSTIDLSNVNRQTLIGYREKLKKRISAVNYNSKIKSILDIATAYLPVETSDFDSDPSLLNLKNGVYNFKTDELLVHSVDQLFYKQLGTEFLPDSKCVMWLTFLNRIFNYDQDLILYIQKSIGYSLTGYTDSQIVNFCYGGGGNGKSLFFAVLRLLLSDYSVQFPIQHLLVKKFENSTTEYQFARLKGVRCVVGTEVPKDARLNESAIKDLTGGEKIVGRNPCEKPFEFTSTLKPWLFGNHKLIISGVDKGIWRRIKLIPFVVQIPDNEKRDFSEMLAEFESELPGILQWAIEGYRKLKEEGWKFPSVIENASAQYEEESNNINDFLLEKTKKVALGSTSLSKLYITYMNWCKENGERSTFNTAKKISQEMKRKGYVVDKGGGNKTVVRGIVLQEDTDSA